MKIFSWVQDKLSGKKSSSVSASNHIRQPCKDEFCDWPHGLLAIGTFGNKMTQEQDHNKPNPQGTIQSCGQDHLHGLTPEEVGKLQKELNLIFHEHVGVEQTSSTNLEAEERNCTASSEAYSNNKTDPDLQNSSGSLVQNRGKDICLDNSRVGAIGKKSLSFLLKKMFVCRSGISPAPTPSLRDPVLESRMEKMLRTILHKKIYPQSSSPKLSTKKSLGSSNHILKAAASEDYEKVERPDDGSKWVKTDSEYIVLEI